MNFFEHQEQARKNSRWLVFLFFLAVICIVLAVNLAVQIVFQLSGVSNAPALAEHTPTLLNLPEPAALIPTTVFTLILIGLGSLIRISQIRGLGGSLPEKLGATRISAETSDPNEKKLMNIVEEMSIASGSPIPWVYLLDQEDSVNAFAAGLHLRNSSITVTRGSIEKLNRDELQGVVAHEFSHILNGDMRQNTTLIGVLNGILMIGYAGRALLRVTQGSRSSRDSRAIAMIALLGFFLWLIGSIGVFFGSLIKAAVSRQREFLADASAVQFTRNPDGIGGALLKISKEPESIPLESRSAEEFSHMFFVQAFSSWLSSLIGTHPPLKDRILRINPGLFSSQPKPRKQAPPPALHASSSVNQIGKLTPQALEGSIALLSSLPEDMKYQIQTPHTAVWYMLAICLDLDPAQRGKQLGILELSLDKKTADFIETIFENLKPNLIRLRLPILELCIPALQGLNQPEKVNLLKILSKLILSDGEVVVFEYCLISILRNSLTAKVKPPATRYSNAGRLLSEVSTLIALLAAQGTQTKAEAEKTYLRGMSFFLEKTGVNQLPPPRSEIFQPEVLDSALARLSELAPAAKQILIETCEKTVLMDQVAIPREAEILRTLCAHLQCPMPLLTT